MNLYREQAANWGAAVRGASHLVQQLTTCQRVYFIAFGEGARYLHVITRFSTDPATEA